MAEDLPIGRTLRMRECAFDEFWLQEQIWKNPGSLGLGELEPVQKERRQSGGGRLDILLKNSEDDSMYEVELMLGETDESHIIRTIEYWDNERRKWPQRQHYAVLVAEFITRRFFNLIQLLSQTIPLIAIQANIVEAEGKRLLHFTTVLDTYEEPEEPGADSSEVIDEDYWRKHYLSTTETAAALLSTVRDVLGQASFRYQKTTMVLSFEGNDSFWFYRRIGQKSRLGFWLADEELEEAKRNLDEAEISYVLRPRGIIVLTTDKGMLASKAETFKRVAALIRQSRTR